MATEIAKAGAKAPLFELLSSTGETINLADYKGSRIVLYFYPRADTPGCTKEACGFRDAIAGYKKLGVPVFGISPDPVKDVTKFAEKFKLNFPLLADEDHAVAEKYGVWQEKSLYGRKFMGIARTTYLIGPDGKVLQRWDKVKVDGHAEAVTEALEAT